MSLVFQETSFPESQQHRAGYMGWSRSTGAISGPYKFESPGKNHRISDWYLTNILLANADLGFARYRTWPEKKLLVFRSWHSIEVAESILIAHSDLHCIQVTQPLDYRRQSARVTRNYYASNCKSTLASAFSSSAVVIAFSLLMFPGELVNAGEGLPDLVSYWRTEVVQCIGELVISSLARRRRRLRDRDKTGMCGF